ncbi:putative bifunctional diguanylate cyclase/phosphodiesterase [Geodermatophilus sp. SYSU D00815]
MAYGAVAVLGLAGSGVLWTVGRRQSPPRRGWRLIAVALLFPVLGALLAAVARPSSPLEVAVLRWLPTVPGYLVAIAGILTLVDRRRLRAGLRGAVELALFVTACLVVVQLLIIGPGGRWSSLELGQRLVLAAAVVATSLTMAAGLTLLGVVEAHRQRMAVVLLGGAFVLTVGRGLSTAALLFTAHGVAVVSQFLVVGGLTLVVLSAFADPGQGTTGRRARGRAGRTTELGQVLPHAAMVVAVTTVGTAAVFGHQPSGISYVGGTACIVLTGVHRWVTAREEQRLSAHIRRNEAYFRSLVASGADAAVILDAELRLVWASPALERMLGAAAVPLPGRALLDVVHPDDADALAAAVPSGTAGDEERGGVLLLRMADSAGRWRSLEASVSDLRRDPDVGAVVLHCRDVTEREAREAALRGVAYTDPMTGLPNSAGLERALQGALAEPEDDGAGSTLLLIELEGLAEVREYAGRHVVTAVEAEVGRRLRATVRAEDVVARMGFGGFGVLARSAGTEADQLADRCLAVVEQPIATTAGIVDLTASVGLVVLAPDVEVDELLARGELAVRAARATGPGASARYTPALGEAAARRQRLLDDLHGATARGELFLLFSPIVSLEEQRVTGVEALLGWRHPELGDLEAAEFLPVAERAGLVGELQRWALDEATRVAAGLPGTGGTALRLGVDLAASYVAGGTLVTDVENALHRSGLAPERLVLEVPEATAVADDERIALDIASVRLMGVHVALDRFGAGRSSLASLTRLPVDILKLDRSLLARLDRDPQDRALCESVVGIGRALGVDVVAEGVETPAQLATLCSLSCGFAQGFLISRPLPLAGLIALLRDRAGQLWPGMVGQR